MIDEGYNSYIEYLKSPEGQKELEIWNAFIEAMNQELTEEEIRDLEKIKRLEAERIQRYIEKGNKQ